MRTPHIVIVDDDDSVRSVLEEMAREAVPSADVSSHTSALHALQEIHSSQVDLLITNCQMPDMDGPTLVKTLRAEKNAVPVIMVSGSDDARAIAEGLGVGRFVPKHALHSALTECHPLAPRGLTGKMGGG